MLGKKQSIERLVVGCSWAILEKTKARLSTAQASREARDKPFVTLTYAQSLDGSIASVEGRPLPLSSSESLALTHALRASHDAILVGIGCVLADNPRLTVREVSGRSPLPIVLDSRLRLPLYARLLHQDLKPWVITTSGADEERQTELEKTGARVIRMPADRTGQIDLRILLLRLKEMGIVSLLVEGGARVITGFLSARLVDQLVITIAPVLVGGLRILDNLGRLNHNGTPRLLNVSYEELDQDLILRGDLDWTP